MYQNPATIKQVALIQKLIAERDYSGVVDYANLTSSGASKLIEELFTIAKASVKRVTELGMYQTADGAIYRVHKSRETGNLYAKRLSSGGGFEYEYGAITKLTPADRMTLEQAKAYGVETGLCCVCGAFLTDPKSVEQGIGPVCATRF